MHVIHHRYGKAKVRVLKVLRSGEFHELKELSLKIMLSGQFQASFSEGDNRLVVATDSMKNIVNFLAFEHLGLETEPFLALLAGHFLAEYPQIEQVELEAEEPAWERLSIEGAAHPHAFKTGGEHRLTARLTQTGGRTDLASGIENLLILKSTESGFENFVRDKFTTLPDAHDRIFATRVDATWHWAGKPGGGYRQANQAIVDEMLRIFATRYSVSVQATLYDMAVAALTLIPELSIVRIAMPNQHCLKIPLGMFGVGDNPNVLFVPTDEPHGQIEATVAREPGGARFAS